MKFDRAPFVLAAVAMLCCPWQTAATEFASSQSYPVGTNPSGIAIGDFNGDGKPDIAVVNSGSNNVSILLGNGDGTFQAAKNFDVGNSMTSIAVGDFNGDGKLDVVVFLPGNFSVPITGEIRILMGNGDGTLQAPKVTTLTVSAAAISAGDFNSDKKWDLIVFNIDSSTEAVTLEILIGKGDGTFESPQTIPSQAQGANFAVADFNKDGKIDLAIVVSGGVQVLLGKGDGTFHISGTVTVETGFIATTILTADMDGDGRLDLLVKSQLPFECKKANPFDPCPPPPPQHFSFFPGLGNGTFGSGVIQELNHCCIVLGDFNGDGKTDLADDSLEIRLGRGDGSFTPPIPASKAGYAAAVQDFNGDKLDDFVILDSLNNAILVLLNDSPLSGADVGITSAGPDGTVGQATNVKYFADVLNEGPEDATNVVFTDTLPDTVTFVSATSTVGNCALSGPVVTCSVGPLKKLADVQINIVATPTAIGTFTNVMSVSAAEPDLALANNSATQTDTVVPVYTLTVSKTGSGSGTVQGGGLQNGRLKISCGSTCSATFLSGTTPGLIEFADSGSFFQSWGGACSGSSACSLTMNSDMTVTATFTLEPLLNVKFAGGGAGTVRATDGSLMCSNTDTTCSSQYAPGSSVSLTAATAQGSTFTGWSGACTGMDPNTCNVTLNESQSVTATFNPLPDFSVSPASKSLTAQSGGQVTDVISISEQSGFTSAIQLSCSVTGPAPLPSCSLSPNLIPPGANSPTSTLTFSAGKLATSLPMPLLRAGNLFASLFLFVLVWYVLLPMLDKRQQRQWALCFLILIAAMLPIACGGGNTTPPPVSQTYMVTVTATSGALQHSTAVAVTVQ